MKAYEKYIQKFTDLTEKAMSADPSHITNRVIIFLFIKDLYNHNIQKWISGAKMVNSIADAFKLAHQSLLKLKNMKVYCTMRNVKYQKKNSSQRHTNINQSIKGKFTSKTAVNKTSNITLTGHMLEV